MDKIRPWLFIGEYSDTLDKGHLDQNSIRAMLQLAEVVEQPGIESLYLRVEDMENIPFGKIEEGVRFIRRQAAQGRTLLIACGAGINRSTAFCLIALREIEGLGLFDAFQDVLKRHPDSLPNLRIWESLCDYYNDPTPYLDVMRLAGNSIRR